MTRPSPSRPLHPRAKDPHPGGLPVRLAAALGFCTLALLAAMTLASPISAQERTAHREPRPAVATGSSGETSGPTEPARRTGNCVLRGQVRSTTGEAISGATVTVLPEGARAATDAAGNLCLTDLEPGPRRLLVVAESFVVADAEVELVAGRSTEIEVTLQPAFGHEVVVTATRTAKRLEEVPIQLQIVDREKIENVVARNLAEAVEWTSGIRVESNCQNCNESKIRMLGLEGGYSQILIDGQPTVSSLALVYGIEQLPARLIDSIEVVKGGGSALYGAGAVGGVINLIPHQPSRTGAEIELRLGDMSGEETGSMNGFLDWTSADRGRSLSVYAQRDRVDPVDIDGDGFTEVTRRRLETAGLRWDQFFFEGQGRLAGEVNRIREDRRGGDRLHLPPEQASIAEEIRTDRIGASLSWMHSVSSELDYRLIASFADTDRDSYYGAGMDPDAFGFTDNPHAVFDAQINHYRRKSTLTWGVQRTRDGIRDVQLGRDRIVDDVYTNTGIFLQEDRQIAPRLSVLYGVRLDDHSEVTDPIASPRAALMWSPSPQVTLRTSLARGFRPPVVFDEDLHISLLGGGQAQVIRNDPGLSEETSTNAMMSLSWYPTVGRRGLAALELALFRTDIDNLFHNLETDDPRTPDRFEFTKINLGSARVQGAELNLSFRWSSRLSTELGLVRQTARFDRPEPDFGSRDFFRTPETYGVASLQWSPKPVEIFVGALYTGTMTAKHFAGFIAEDRLERTPSSLTWDVNLSRTFELGPGEVPLTLTLGAKNLTDEFQEDLDRGPDRDSNYVYGPRFPRSYFLSVRVGV